MLHKNKYLKEFMRTILKLRDVKETLMECIKGTLPMVKDKGMEHLNGIMERNFRVIGKMELNVGLESGDLRRETVIRDSG
jgi:hypothetical protein